MTTQVSPRRVLMLPLDKVIRFDNEAILAAKESAEACSIAEHTLARLEQVKAPKRYFELVLRDGLMKRKEMQKQHHFLMHDTSILLLATRFGRHATTKTKERLIVIANYFQMYRLTKETVQVLRNGPMTPNEFLSMADCFSVSSSTMDESAYQMIRDARIAHGERVEQKVRAALQKRYDDWNGLPDL